ncbi:MAG: hypothetical protein ACE5GA_01455 [Candidatus Zixiibacteriota bacterium]
MSRQKFLTPDSGDIAESVIRHRVFQGWITVLALMFFLWLIPNVSSAQPYDAVEVQASVTLTLADSSRTIVVEERVWKVPLRRRFSAFLANMSLELMSTALDSQRVELTVFLTTVGPRPDSRNRRFSMELELPAWIDRIRGKNGATYRLKLVPREFTFVDFSECGFDHRDSGVFRMDPTAHFDLYFIPQSLGDYHWNKIKQLLEQEYRLFKSAFDINMAGKLHFYLHPCASPTLAWDPRFGYAIDPSRAQAHALYSHSYMGASPLVATLTQTLRVSGYAPPFLAEGISAYFYFYEFETLRALRNGEIIHLRDLLTTQQYYSADPLLASAQAGSFCRFLADTYGIGRFHKLYSESDDLTIAGKFSEHYGADIDALENQWVEYLRRMHPGKSRFFKRASLEGAANNIELGISILQEGLGWDTTFADTLATLAELAPLYTQTGKYDLALKTNQALFDKSSAEHPRRDYYLLRVAYLSALNGEFQRSREAYVQLRKLDTSRAESVDFGLARLLALEGDTAAAIDSLTKLLAGSPGLVAVVEGGLLKAELLGVPGTFRDSAQSNAMFEKAHLGAKRLIGNAVADPLNRYRQGLAELGLGRFEQARQDLEIALFLEFRPRQLGRELIALGKLADLLGNREQALTYYHRADSVDQSAPGQQEIQRHLRSPFTLGPE